MIARELLAHCDVVDVDACRTAWRRLVDDLVLQPTHEIVEVEGRSLKRFFAAGASPKDQGRWTEVTAGRIAAWRAPGIGTARHPRYGEVEARVETDIDLFLTKDGTLWRGVGSPMSLWISSTDRGWRRTFVLPRGEAFRTEPRGWQLHVVGSTAIEAHHPTSPNSRSAVGPPRDFVKAMAAVLTEARP